MAPFSKAIVELGGLERVYLLIMIARFDMNRDGSISQQEFESARIQGEKCVSNAVTGCANFAIISALQRGQSALWAVCPRSTPAPPQGTPGGSGSSGGSGRFDASKEEGRPLPRLLERAASKAADSPTFDHLGTALQWSARADHRQTQAIRARRKQRLRIRRGGDDCR